MGTKFIGTDSEKTSLNAYITLLRANDTIATKSNIFITKNKLSMSQFGVLECLHYLGPLCQKTISEKILKSTANITTVIDNLEKQNYVKRVRQEEDRRYITVTLTESGKKLIESILPKHIEEILNCMSVLDPEEITELYRICKKLGLSNTEKKCS